MSYNNYLEAQALINNHKEMLDASFPQNLTDIEIAENLLKVTFPKSYKKFLHDFGWISFGCEEIFGLTNKNNFEKAGTSNVVNCTLKERKLKKELQLPHHFIGIHKLGNGEISCIDTSRINGEGECPVVGWYFGAKEDIADDFGAFLLEKVKFAISDK